MQEWSWRFLMPFSKVSSETTFRMIERHSACQEFFSGNCLTDLIFHARIQRGIHLVNIIAVRWNSLVVWRTLRRFTHCSSVNNDLNRALKSRDCSLSSSSSISFHSFPSRTSVAIVIFVHELTNKVNASHSGA